MSPYEQGFMSKCAEAWLTRLQALSLYKQALSASDSVLLAGGAGALAGGGLGALFPVKKDKHSRRRRLVNALAGAVLGGGVAGGLMYSSKDRMFNRYAKYGMKRDWDTDYSKIKRVSNGVNGITLPRDRRFPYFNPDDNTVSPRIIGESKDVPGFYFFDGEPNKYLRNRIAVRDRLSDMIDKGKVVNKGYSDRDWGAIQLDRDRMFDEALVQLMQGRTAQNDRIVQDGQARARKMEDAKTNPNARFIGVPPGWSPAGGR